MTFKPPSDQARKRLSILAFGLAGCVLLAALVLVLTGHGSCSVEDRASLHRLEPATVLHVSDGDTLFVRLDDGREGYVRLVGIDAPESVNPDETLNTPEGQAAADFVKTLVPPGTRVWLARDVSDVDRYGRWLRYVWLEEPDDVLDPDEVRERMLNGIIVASGHAEVKRYPPDVAYHEVLLSLAENRRG